MKGIRELWIEIWEQLFKVQLKTYNFKVGLEQVFLNPHDIIRIEADSNYSTLYTTDDKFLLSMNISSVEKILNGWGMVRIGRSHIINVVHISRIKSTYPGYIILSDGKKIDIPKRKNFSISRRLEKMKS